MKIKEKDKWGKKEFEENAEGHDGEMKLYEGKSEK